MATWKECDKCGTTTKEATARTWSVCKLNEKSFDLCGPCYRAVLEFLSTGLSGDQQAALSQIWENATSFDQSIGDVR